MLSKHWIVLACCLPIVLALAGCGETVEPITSYRVAKDDAVYKANHVAREEIKPVKGRMLAAMIIDGPNTWFFKVMGPDEKIAVRLKAFANLVDSVKFERGIPTWKTPQGWKQLPDNDPKNRGFMPRLATIVIDPDDDNAPELTVTKLPTAIIPMPGKSQQELEDNFILSNVDRWRKQLQLNPTTLKKLYQSQEGGADKVEEVVKNTVDGRTRVFVHLTGTLPAPGGGRPPMMGRGR